MKWAYVRSTRKQYCCRNTWNLPCSLWSCHSINLLYAAMRWWKKINTLAIRQKISFASHLPETNVGCAGENARWFTEVIFLRNSIAHSWKDRHRTSAESVMILTYAYLLVTRRPASADRTARRQFQATGQPVCRTQASDEMMSRLPRYEAKCVQRRCFQWASVPLRSDIKGTELPPVNILIPLERQLIALQLCHWQLLFMAALCNRAGCAIYIFILSFVLSFFLFFFPCLISAVADWMSTILAHMVWP